MRSETAILVPLLAAIVMSFHLYGLEKGALLSCIIWLLMPVLRR